VRRDGILYDFKAAFGRAGCGRLASLAVLAGQHQDDHCAESSARDVDELLAEPG
jgi:hypothetical protein